MIAEQFTDFSARKLEQLLARIETCVAPMTPEQLWARGGEHENAVGNLLLHLSGNVRQWVVHAAAGEADVRNRPAEFAARADADPMTPLRATVAEACAAIRALDEAGLARRVQLQGFEVSVLEAVYHAVEHFSMHTGQIILLHKQLTGSDPNFYGHLGSAHSERTP